MKVLVVSGSRNPEGQTARAADALLKGAATQGWEGKQVFLPQIRIERCRQCDDAGWGTCRTDGKCVIADDFAGVVEKIKAADAVVFATPVYFGDLSESLKTFLDRLRRISIQEDGRKGLEGRAALGICVAGGGGGGAPSCTVHLESVLRTCGFNIVDMVPARRQNLDMKLEVLNIVGSWLARTTEGDK